MNDWNDRANEYFLEALERPEGQRAAYLDGVCRGSPDLRRHVDSLLAALDKSKQFMERPLVDTRVAMVDWDVAAEPHLHGDKYRLGEKIGLGGMGVVYAAEQLHPIRRRVAVKLIRNIDDPVRLLARFEQERQTLALMEHPNIARVLDAGTSADERPFLVMEFIDGEAITKYCDDRRLTQAARLELFIQTCKGVQHAHQKGAIHRDLKPSNILVTESDGHPTPKIIDFGVAKVFGPKHFGSTFHTDAGMLVGTLEYMAPEQLGPGVNIDVRADVYSLGVILYELLTGSLPFDRERLRSSPLDEAVRLIRDSNPPMMSTKLRTAETLDEVAAARGVEPRVLAASLRGDLDWIVQRCLEKDPDRRYPSALDLARDLERRLAHEPVEARPASAGYRLRKFVRRHRVTVTAASAVTIALIAGVFGLTHGMFEARRAQSAETAARVRAETTRDRALDAMDAMTSIAVGDALGSQPELSQEQKDFLAQSLDHYRAFVEENPDDEASRKRVAQAAVRLGLIEFNLGRHSQSVDAHRRAIDLFSALAHEYPTDDYYANQRILCRVPLSQSLLKVGRPDDAERELLSTENDILGLIKRRPSVAFYEFQLARVRRILSYHYFHIGELPRAEATVLDVITRLEGAPSEQRGEKHARRELANAYRAMGAIRFRQNDHHSAIAASRKELSLREGLVATNAQPQFDEHALAVCRTNIGLSLSELGEHVEGEKFLRESIATYEQLTRKYPGVSSFRRGYARNWENVGNAATERKRMTEAGEAYRQAIAILDKARSEIGANTELNFELARLRCNFGRYLHIAGRHRESIESLDQSIVLFEEILARDSKNSQSATFLRKAHSFRFEAHRALGSDKEALTDIDRVVALSPPAERMKFRLRAVYMRAKCGDKAQTLEEINELAEIDNQPGENFATYAVALAILAHRDSNQSEEYLNRAMEHLQRAIEKGYSDINMIKTNSAFSILRGRQDFADLLALMEKRSELPKK